MKTKTDVADNNPPMNTIIALDFSITFACACVDPVIFWGPFNVTFPLSMVISPSTTSAEAPKEFSACASRSSKEGSADSSETATSSAISSAAGASSLSGRLAIALL